MITVCSRTSNANPLTFPKNMGVSVTAYALEDYVRDIEETLLARTMSIGRHYWETRKSLAEALESSAADNWDGYGARPIDPESCLKAIQFSDLLPMDIPLPEIEVDTDGEIRFEWYRSPRQVLSVAVGGDGALAYAGLFGASKTHGTEYISDELPTTILDSIRRVYS
jgi:hypothetical protein